MVDNAKRLKPMLFKYETTTETAFRPYKGADLESVRSSECKYYTRRSRAYASDFMGPSKTHRQNHEPLKDVSAMSHWRKPYLPPFDLFGNRKGIIQTDPRELQQPYFKNPDCEKEMVQKTRPVVAQTPAGNLDSMCKQSRKILIDDIYMTTSRKAAEHTIDLFNRREQKIVKAPSPKTAAPANPILLPYLDHPYVSPEWRLESASWECKQLRTYIQPSEEFWTKRSKSKVV